MSELYKAKGGSGSLGCTSNDIRVAGVALRTVPGPNGEPVGSPHIDFLPTDTDPHLGCRFPNDTVKFKARFNVVLSATARHDIGIFFSVDGDDNGDGAYTSDNDIKPTFNTQTKKYVDGGGCVAATPQYAPSPFINLDGVSANPATQDRCGDISGNAPLQPEIEITTVCDDPDGDGLVNLPVCLSWRQPGANEMCTSPEDAFPGAPSKCNCDAGFEVPITIPPGTISVIKESPGVDTVMEPGGLVTFTVTVKNDAPFKANTTALDVTVTEIVDDKFGVLFDDVNNSHESNSDISNNTCATLDDAGANPDNVLKGQETLTCSFKALVSGPGNSEHINEVTAIAVNRETPPRELPPASDTDKVNIIDVVPVIDVTKTANPTEVLEPGGTVQFTVVVTNPGTNVEPLTITSLIDSDFGNVFSLPANSGSTCSPGQSLAIGTSCIYKFTKNITGAPSPDPAVAEHINRVTVIGADDDGNSPTDYDDESVNIVNNLATIDVTKTANPTVVNEPGGVVSFTVSVKNESAVDTVTIQTLTDLVNNVPRNITSTANNPAIITTNCAGLLGNYAPLQTKSCTFTALVDGNAGFVEADTVTATGIDDDGDPVSDNASATVTVQGAAPAATLVKTVESARVTFKVVITNNSNAQDPITLIELKDSVNGGDPIDITSVDGPIVSTTCQTGGTILPGGPAYQCTFDAIVTESQTDTVTGKLKDDENTDVSPDPSDSATVNIVD